MCLLPILLAGILSFPVAAHPVAHRTVAPHPLATPPVPPSDFDITAEPTRPSFASQDPVTIRITTTYHGDKDVPLDVFDDEWSLCPPDSDVAFFAPNTWKTKDTFILDHALLGMISGLPLEKGEAVTVEVNLKDFYYVIPPGHFDIPLTFNVWPNGGVDTLPIVLHTTVSVTMAPPVPPSKMDRVVQQTIGNASQVIITGRGPTWQQLTHIAHLANGQGVIVKGKPRLKEIIASLQSRPYARSQTVQPDAKLRAFQPDGITISMVPDHPHGHPIYLSFFTCCQDPKGIHLGSTNDLMEAAKSAAWDYRLVAPSRFNALVSRLSTLAKAPGQHPDVTLEPPPSPHLPMVVG